jgi:hypothetical protein
MRYNLIAWSLANKGPEPILICDTWFMSRTTDNKEDPLQTIKEIMDSPEPRATRAIIIDFTTNKVIYESKTTINGYFIDTLDNKPKTYHKYGR